MRVISVDFYPLQVYYTPEEAIRRAKGHPLQGLARDHTKRLAGAEIADAWWTDTDFVIRFSGERYLHISVSKEGTGVTWQLVDVSPPLDPSVMERIGSPPIVVRWPSSKESTLDRTALAAKRRGCQFQKVWVNETGLLVYCQGHHPWGFHPIRRMDTNQPILYVGDEH